MKQFFKIFFASLLSFIVGTFLLFFILLGIISLAISGSNNKETVISSNSVLKISFNQPLEERSSGNPLENFDLNNFSSKQQPGLNDILECIDKAANDDKIKGIYIDASDVQGGLAMMQELRDALIKFKKSKKFVFAYAENYSQGAYYLASAADKIYLNPQGTIELHGLMSQLLFFKGTLDKLEIQPELIRHGKFKSAGETFVSDKMSDENKRQIAAIVNDLWNNIALEIADSRKIETSEVNNIADSLLVRNAEDALKYHLADHLAYYDEFTHDINQKLGNKKEEKLSFVSLNKYNHSPDPRKSTFSSDRIAIIYATGEIQSGEGSDENINADEMSAAIRKARTDDHIKAIVLRINSPGGSAIASETIWREVSLASKAKPLVVSMSDVAASGGYYISCGARKIIAHPNTITGSIGVFGLLFNAQAMLKKKLGITTDGYKTGIFTDLGTMTRPITPSEEKILQMEVDRIYGTFLQRVSEGRSLSIGEVDSLAQGRVWSGTAALNNHLIDTTGGLKDAIAIAATMAHLKNYRIRELPEQKKMIQQLMDDFSTKAMAFTEKQSLSEEYIITTGIQFGL